MPVDAARDIGLSERCLPFCAGENHYSVLHVEDAATAYVAALQYGSAGRVYNTASETGITAKQLATAISEKLSTPEAAVPIRSISQEEAKGVYGPALAPRFASNDDVDVSRARQELHWQPKHTSGFLQVLAKP